MEIYNKNRPMPPHQKVLEIIQLAWEGEQENIIYMNKLIKLAKDPSDKEILRLTYMDEHKHAKYFAEIYRRLCGQAISENVRVTQRTMGWDICLEYEKMIHKCTDVVEFYRRIYFGFSDTDIRDMLFEVITDEMNLAVKMSHLCNKNRKFF